MADHDHEAHGHSHSRIDPSISSSDRGVWAVKWSFIGLFVTAAIQLAVVIFSNSIGLLADTIHNFGDAATAIPLGIAFMFARRKPSNQFTYGFGRVEDFAGVLVVLTIFASAAVAAYESIQRLIHPQRVEHLAAVAIASVLGFLGNEVVAIFRIRVGKEIGSAALIADGYHARTDGWTSLAVLVGALGVWLGYPKADPIRNPHHHRHPRHRVAFSERSVHAGPRWDRPRGFAGDSTRRITRCGRPRSHGSARAMARPPTPR